MKNPILSVIVMIVAVWIIVSALVIVTESNCPTCPEPETVGVDTVTVIDTLWLKSDVVWPDTWPDDWPENLFWVDIEEKRKVETDSVIYFIQDKIRELRKVDSSSWVVYFIRRDSGFSQPRGHRIFTTVAEDTILSADTTCYRREECGEGEL